MSNTRFVPVRTCIACRKSGDKNGFLRIVKRSDGEIFLDFEGKSEGRGAYVCDNVDCIKKLTEKKLLSKAFSQSVDQAVYDKIKEDYANSKS